MVFSFELTDKEIKMKLALELKNTYMALIKNRSLTKQQKKVAGIACVNLMNHPDQIEKLEKLQQKIERAVCLPSQSIEREARE